MHRLAEDVNRQLLEMAETVARVLKFPIEGELEVSRIEIVPQNATSVAEGRCSHFMVDGHCGAYCDPPGICMVCP
jgi:hypothetical protein